MTEANNQQTNLVRYPLATAWRRLGAKALDILIITLVIFGLGIAIIATNPGFKWNEWVEIQPWRYLLVGIITFIIFTGLMFVLPLFTDWTIGMKALKLKYVHILPLSKRGWNLFKHEILIWGIMCILSLILGIVLGCLNKTGQARSLILGIQTLGINSKQQTEVTSWPLYYVGVVFACCYYCSALLLLVIIISLFVKNKKPTFYDKFSNIVVIHLSPMNDPDKQHNTKKMPQKKINFGVPGEINSGSFEELDNLE